MKYYLLHIYTHSYTHTNIIIAAVAMTLLPVTVRE